MGLIGRNGVITIATVAVGSVKNINVDISAEKLKEYVMGNDKPDSLDAGNKSFTFSIDKLFVDSTHINQVMNGTVVAIAFSPAGTSAQKYTINSAILDKGSIKQSQGGYVMHNVTGEGMGLTWSST
jgi:sporulation protein YlmC with PRC-barrel domain